MTGFKSFIGDRQGNFAIMSALLAVPLIGTAGLAVDVSEALAVRVQLQGAADAAAIGSLTQKSNAFAQAAVLSANGTFPLDATEAKQIFTAQSPAIPPWQNLNLNISLSKQSGILTSNVNFTATVPTTLMNVLGKPSITVSGTASAHYETPLFLDIYMLVDNTPSMGIGATESDMAIMRAATHTSSPRPDCAFACHFTTTVPILLTPIPGVTLTAPDDYYAIDKKAGATIRLDLVATSITDTINKVKDTEILSNQMRLSAYAYGIAGAVPTPDITTVISPTTDLSVFAGATSNIQLMKMSSADYSYGQTDYNAALNTMAGKITSIGTGNGADDRKPVLVMIGDGLSDDQNTPLSACTGTVSNGRCLEPVRTSYCDAIKQRGIQLAVLYTTYTPVPEDSGYVSNIMPWQDQIPAMMKACASPGMYVEITPTQNMGQAMDALFASITGSPRLTQ